MLTTLDLLELVKKSAGNCTDYRAAKLLGVRHQTVSTWASRGSVMEESTAVKAAEIAGINAEYVLACLAAERAKGSNTFPMWRHIAKRLEPKKIATAAAVLAALILPLHHLAGIV